MLEKLKIFKTANLEEYYENGFSDEYAGFHYTVNPYSNTHNEDEYTAYENISYTYVINGDLDYNKYLIYENLFVDAFKKIYESNKVYGLAFSIDKYTITEYFGFLSFKDDLIQVLREKGNIKFVLDDLKIAIDCNYDLIISIFIYSDKITKNVQSILNHFLDAGLFVIDINNT